MMTAEKWYEYQGHYKRYGLDMKPRAVKQVHEHKSESLTPGDKIKVILLLLFIGVLCVCLIISTAYTAGVKFEINSIIKESAMLQGEIENLNVKIKNATNIRTIEEKAINELGMIQPLPEHFVFLNNNIKPQGDFAMLLKDQAYN